MTDDKSALPTLREDLQKAAEQLGLIHYPEEHRSYRQLLFGDTN